MLSTTTLSLIVSIIATIVLVIEITFYISIRKDLFNMLKSSERRMDVNMDKITNIVCNLSDSSNHMSHTSDSTLEALYKITEEYTKQLDHLQKCRDQLIEQNAKLIETESKLIHIAATPKTTINNN